MIRVPKYRFVKVTSVPDLRVPRSTDQEREVEEVHDDREAILDLSNNLNEGLHVASDVQQPLRPRRTQRRRIQTTPIQIDPSGSHAHCEMFYFVCTATIQ